MRIIKWVNDKVRQALYSKCSVFLLGITIGATSTFNYIYGQNIFSQWEKSTIEIKSVEAEVIKEEVKEDPLQEIVEQIAMAESGNGKQNYSKCEKLGLNNRTGYAIPGNGTYACFEGDGDKVATHKWLEQCLNTYQINSCLCGYNTGSYTADCPYLSNFTN